MSLCIAIAIGDPNGIGPEIAVKAALALQGRDARPVLVGDAHVIAHYLAQSEADCELLDFDQWWGNGVASASRASPNGQTPTGKSVLYVPVSALSAKDFVPGKVSAAAGRATVGYVTRALNSLNKAGSRRLSVVRILKPPLIRPASRFPVTRG